MIFDAVAVVRPEGAAIRLCALGTAHRMGELASPAHTSKRWGARARSSMRQQAAVLPKRRHA